MLPYAVLLPVEVLFADDSTSCAAVEMIARSITLFLFRNSDPFVGDLTVAGPLVAFRPLCRLLGDLAIVNRQCGGGRFLIFVV
jgi:hypothetical protein